MNTWADKMMRHQQVLLFAGLLFWQAIVKVLDSTATPGWSSYLEALLIFAAVQIPAWIFMLYKEHLKQRARRSVYRVSWFLCFGMLQPLFAIGAMILRPGGYPQSDFFLVGVSVISLELLLEINSYFRNNVMQSRWLKKIDLEKAILVTITLIAVLLSAMAVSGMDDPGHYNEKGHLLVYPVLSLSGIFRHFGTFLALSLQFLLVYLLGYLFFFINSRFLVPRVLKQQGLLQYVLSGLAIVALLSPLMAQLVISLPMNKLLGKTIEDNAFNTIHFFIAIMINLLSLPLVLAIQWNRQNNQILLLEKEKVVTELDLLKQQLNPHFFFNTLNNLYALSLTQSSAAPESILQLSDLMRYVIYKGKEERVSLKEEVKYLEDYIQLQQMRLQHGLDLRFEQTIGDGLQMVAPLLLIVFVENAFKHGVEPAEDKAFLQVHLSSDAERLYFCCENSFEHDAVAKGGVGLHNLQRRLDLLYPGSYKLQTSAENHIFKAELVLHL